MLTITLLSLVVAAASGLLAWRSIRREQVRSHARVAALASAIDEPTFAPRAAETAWTFDHSLEFRSEAAALEFRGEADELTFEALDAEPIRRRLLTMVTGACVVVAGVVWIAMMSDRYEPPPRPIVPPHAEPLELISLEAAREGSRLAITGVVRSRAEEPLTTVMAVVSAIDAKGRPIGRGSVPLTTILPRHESRFAVTIADGTEAARYRVSFRSATGVIRHIDRRTGRPGNES